MCYKATSWSRLALLLGLVAIVVQALSLFTGSWLVTRELLVPDQGGRHAADPAAPAALYWYGSVLLYARIGLLRTCTRAEKTNTSNYPHPLPKPTCVTLTSSSLWREVTAADLGVVHGLAPSTPQVVTNVRQYTLLLGVVALCLMILGELGALVSHFKPSCRLGIVLGCYLYLFAGLVVCLVVVTFSMMTEVPRRDPYFDSSMTMRMPAHKVLETGAPFSWELGSSYYLAVAAFALTHTIAAVLVSAFMKRFSSMEAMVREVVPGADRKLREHQENNLVGLWEIYPSRAMRQLGCINLPGAMGCYGKLPSDGHGQSSKTKPDICSSNPDSSADSLQQHLQQHLQQADDAHHADASQDDQLRPMSPFDQAVGAGARSVSLGQPMSLTAAPSPQPAPVSAPTTAGAAPPPPGNLAANLPPPTDANLGSLAGVSVPITVMRPRPLGHPHRTIPCGALEDPTPLDTFPTYGPGNPGGPAAPGGVVGVDGTMTVARRKQGAAAGGAAGVAGVAGAPGAFSTLDSRARCANARLHNTLTLPHPPRQF